MLNYLREKYNLFIFKTFLLEEKDAGLILPDSDGSTQSAFQQETKMKEPKNAIPSVKTIPSADMVHNFVIIKFCYCVKHIQV